VVDVEAQGAFPVPAGPARVAVALEDIPSQAAEMEQVMPLGCVTSGAVAPGQRRRDYIRMAPLSRFSTFNSTSGSGTRSSAAVLLWRMFEIGVDCATPTSRAGKINARIQNECPRRLAPAP